VDNEYTGSWLSTQHIEKFHFLNPSIDEIDIRDIAHALSLTCRFGGHCSKFYSVAEHSCRVSGVVPLEYALAALLHDSGEAYVPDIPSPIKVICPELTRIEENIRGVIFKKFNVECKDYSVIKRADMSLLMSEADLLGLNTKSWYLNDTKRVLVPQEGIGWTPERAESVFLEIFELTYGGK
jgi:hypothetical protein